MDEMLTPDSPQVWPLESCAEGTSPFSYGKQFVRDWLEQATDRPLNKRQRDCRCRQSYCEHRGALSQRAAATDRACLTLP